MESDELQELQESKASLGKSQPDICNPFTRAADTLKTFLPEEESEDDGAEDDERTGEGERMPNTQLDPYVHDVHDKYNNFTIPDVTTKSEKIIQSVERGDGREEGTEGELRRYTGAGLEVVSTTSIEPSAVLPYETTSAESCAETLKVGPAFTEYANSATDSDYPNHQHSTVDSIVRTSRFPSQQSKNSEHEKQSENSNAQLDKEALESKDVDNNLANAHSLKMAALTSSSASSLAKTDEAVTGNLPVVPIVASLLKPSTIISPPLQTQRVSSRVPSGLGLSQSQTHFQSQHVSQLYVDETRATSLQEEEMVAGTSEEIRSIVACSSQLSETQDICLLPESSRSKHPSPDKFLSSEGKCGIEKVKVLQVQGNQSSVPTNAYSCHKSPAKGELSKFRSIASNQNTCDSSGRINDLSPESESPAHLQGGLGKSDILENNEMAATKTDLIIDESEFKSHIRAETSISGSNRSHHFDQDKEDWINCKKIKRSTSAPIYSTLPSHNKSPEVSRYKVSTSPSPSSSSNAFQLPKDAIIHDDDDISPAEILQRRRKENSTKNKSRLLSRVNKHNVHHSAKARASPVEMKGKVSPYDFGEEEEEFIVSPKMRENTSSSSNATGSSTKKNDRSSPSKVRDLCHLSSNKSDFSSNQLSAINSLLLLQNKSSSTLIEGDIPFSVVIDRKTILRDDSFHNLWKALKLSGWTAENGKHLIDYFYIRSRSDCVLPRSEIDVNNYLKDKLAPSENPFFFTSPEDVRAYVRFCLERYDMKNNKDISDFVNENEDVEEENDIHTRITPAPALTPASSGSESVPSISAPQNIVGKYDTHDGPRWDDMINIFRVRIKKEYKEITCFDSTEIPSLIDQDLPSSLCTLVDAAELFYQHLTVLLSSKAKRTNLSTLLKDVVQTLGRSIHDPDEFVNQFFVTLDSEDVMNAKVEFMIDHGLCFADIWKCLKRNGWIYRRGVGLITWTYKSPSWKKPFNEPEAVINYIKPKLAKRFASNRFKIASESMDRFLISLIEYLRELSSPFTDTCQQPGQSTPLNTSISDTVETGGLLSTVFDWFEEATSIDYKKNGGYVLSWESFIWPELEKIGWNYWASKGLYTIVNIDQYELVKEDENSFRTSVGVRRYLRELFIDRQKGGEKTGTHTKQSRNDTKRKFSHSFLDKNNDCTASSIVQKTPLMASAINLPEPTVTPAAADSKNKCHRSNHKQREDFTGEPQMQSIGFTTIDNLCDHEAQKKGRRKSSLLSNVHRETLDTCGAAIPSVVGKKILSPERQSDDLQATQAIDQYFSPLNAMNSPNQRTSSSSSSTFTNSSAAAVAFPSPSPTYRALPREATLTFAESILPAWCESMNFDEVKSKGTLFSGLRFVIRGFKSSKQESNIQNNGGDLLDSLPHVLQKGSGASFYEKSAACHDSFYHLSRSGRDRLSMTNDNDENDEDNQKWVFQNLIFVSHPNHTKTYLVACALGIPVVHPSWVLDCINRNALQPLGRYQLPTAISLLRPYMTFKRALAPQGVFCGLRILNLVSPFRFSEKDVSMLLNKSIFGSLKDYIKIKTSTDTDKEEPLDWFNACLLADGATLCDPTKEIPKVISAVKSRVEAHSSHLSPPSTRSPYQALVSTYTPPDIIIVDGLHFSDNFVASGDKEMTPHHAIVLKCIAAFEELIVLRQDPKNENPFRTAPPDALTPYDRINSRGHGILATTDWVSSCIGMGTLLPPLGGFLPPEVLGIGTEIKFTPPENFALPKSSMESGELEKLHSWRNHKSGERYSLGDYVYFKSASIDSSCVKVQHGHTVFSIGRIIEFSERKKMHNNIAVEKMEMTSKDIVVKLNLMCSVKGESRAINRTNRVIVGDPNEMIHQKAIVLSGEAFHSLEYCSTSSSSGCRDKHVYYTSNEYEGKQGYVEWSKGASSSGVKDQDQDAFEVLGFDSRLIETPPMELTESIDEDDDYYTGGCLSQDIRY